MAERIVLKGNGRRKGAVSLLPPSDIAPFASMLLVGGLVLALVGWLDVALLWYPPQLGNANWEFGTIGQSMDAMALGTVGLLLVACGIRGRGGNRAWPRLFAILFFVLTVFCVACMGLFALNIGQMFRLVSDPSATPGLRRAIFKTLFNASVYAVGYLVAGVMLWRSTSRRVARTAEAPSEEPAAPA